MKICVLVPSAEHMTQGGVRIRYRRMEAALHDRGHELAVLPIHEVSASSADVYVISKCYDARALVLGRLLAARACLLGVDLFDDYFSQERDPRFVDLRYWLRTLVRTTHFILCSTAGMADVARRYSPDSPLHIMNDPAERLDADQIRLALRRKSEHARGTRIVNIGWFGIGDNPHFPVGLTDVVGFGDDLYKLRARGFEPRLSIVTNERAMTGERLAILRRLALPYTLDAWTEERERQLLARSLVCFLPVNSQGFSIVKSLNRAVSSLCAGAQVLSSGYPLYDALDPFIYRDPARLLDDLTNDSLALREGTVPQLMQLLGERADPAFEAERLIGFLEALPPPARAAVPAGQPLAAVIHGPEPSEEVHKFAQQAGALSVGTPVCSTDPGFDLRFSFADLDLAGSAMARTASPLSIAASHRHVMPRIVNLLQSRYPGMPCYQA